MDNILSYIKWRGDLTVRQSRFNEVDNLILSTLSYLSFDGIIPESPAGSISIGQAAQRYFRLHPLPDEQDIEKMNTGSGREWMFYLMASSRRFRNMRLSNYKNILDPESVKQFTAMTIHTSRNDLYIAYRGTNDTLTGWKEDFLLACPYPNGVEAVDVKDIEKMETINIVKCKDCKYHIYDENSYHYWCELIAGVVKPDFYCACGQEWKL